MALENKLSDFYKTGFDYTKDILKMSSSIEDLVELNELDEKNIIEKIKKEKVNIKFKLAIRG